MKTEFQDLEFFKEKIVKLYKQNPNRSISGLYKLIRKHPRSSLHGDFIILSCIVDIKKELGMELKRNNLNYAINITDEVKNESKKEKNELLDFLMNPLPVVMKPAKNGTE